MPKAYYDVAIIGGGAAGSAAALSLLQAGVERICIVEKSDFSKPRIGETIPPDANLLLHRLGVGQDFAAEGHLPCFGSHSLWGNRQLGHNDFLTSPYGHGWHLDRTRFDKMLLDTAVAAGAALISGEGTSIQTEGDRVTGALVDQDLIEASWFVDATGRGASLSRTFGIVRDVDDRQTVIWARFRVAGHPLGNATWLESVPYGWWYGAELPGGEAVVALGTDPHVAKSDGLFDLRSWAMALSGTDLIAPKIARAQLIPDSFQITSSHSYLTGRVVGANWIAVGDAASAFDPLSSAGVFKALSTGQRAADLIVSQGSKRGAYQDFITDSYIEHLKIKAELYAAEDRWTNHTFWQKRLRLPETVELGAQCP